MSTDLAGIGGNPTSVASSIPSHGGLGDVETPPHTPVSATTGSSGTGYPVQWATPPTNGSADSEGVPLWYRTVADLLDSTDEVTNLEYSRLCLVAAEEPSSVEEALAEECWREAMKTEMKAIEDNRT